MKSSGGFRAPRWDFKAGVLQLKLKKCKRLALDAYYDHWCAANRELEETWIAAADAREAVEAEGLKCGWGDGLRLKLAAAWEREIAARDAMLAAGCPTTGHSGGVATLC